MFESQPSRGERFRNGYTRTIEKLKRLEMERERLIQSTQLQPAPASETREKQLRSMLDEKGFSVHDWAKTAKVDFHTANRFLKGKTNPHPNTLKKLASALGIKVSDLAT